MEKQEKPRKNEWLIPAMGTFFLCGLILFAALDRRALSEPGVTVEVQREVPETVLVPEIPASLDLNEATAEELARLPGIGEELAWHILAYREENGPFLSVEEIMDVPGIGEGKFAALAGQIKVE